MGLGTSGVLCRAIAIGEIRLSEGGGMKLGYSPDCNCLFCAGKRREMEEDRKQDEKEAEGME